MAKTVTSQDIDKLEADFQADPGNFVPLVRGYLERKLALQAIRTCKLGLKSNPNVEDGFLALGMAYYHNYDDQRAEVALKKALRSSPDSAAAHRTLGEIFLDRGQEQKAINELSRSLEIEPHDRHTRTLLESLEEKLEPLESPDGLPEGYWVPRQEAIAGDTPKPFWHAVVQVLIVAILVAGFLVWYSHHIDIRVKVTEAVKKASGLIPRDNFDDLLAAERALDGALALDSDEAKAQVRQATVQSLLWRDHDQQDRKEKLKARLAWMEREDLPNPERFGLKALLMLDAGKAEQAEKFLSEVIERAIEKKDIYLNAMIFGVRGDTRLQMGILPEAREDFSRAVKFSGESPHYQAAFADAYLREGNLLRAIKYFRDGLRQNRGHVYSNIRLAFALVQQGKRLDEANKIIVDLMDRTKHPKEEFSAPLLGMLYLVKSEHSLATGNQADAKTWLAKSLQAFEGSAEAHGLAGRLAALDKDGGKAMQEFTRALQLDPRYPKIYFDRAESQFLLDQKTEAVDKLKDFERHLKPTVPYYVKRSSLKLRADDLQGALDEGQKAKAVDELSAEARFQVALCYQKMGEKLSGDKDKKDEKLALYNQARQWYEDSMILPGGEHAGVYHMMGRIYLDSEDPDNALDNMAKSVMMMQKAGESSLKIAMVYDDIARIFKYLGGPEGERREKIYLAKAQGLREGKTVEQVEQEWAEKEKAEKKRGKRRRKRRRR